MSYDYPTYVAAAQNVLKYPQQNTSVDFQNIIPRMIEYAELRIYRDLDFLATLGTQTTALTANNRNVTLPASVVVCQSINIITPSTQTNPDLGTRNPIERVSLDWLNAVYNSGTNATVPEKYALVGAPTVGGTITAGPISIILGPWPDATYTAEVIGTVRPSPLSPTNVTTFLSTYMPDLFFAASMIFGFGFQRDFGAQSDDPRTAQSWEQQYQALKSGADTEELRKKAASVSWSPYIPTPVANTQRERSNAPA